TTHRPTIGLDRRQVDVTARFRGPSRVRAPKSGVFVPLCVAGSMVARPFAPQTGLGMNKLGLMATPIQVPTCLPAMCFAFISLLSTQRSRNAVYSLSDHFA